jgi:UDP-glucose 4-epimerase
VEVLITGGSGFVGQRLVQALFNQKEHHLRVAIRSPRALHFGSSQVFSSMDLGTDTNWHDALQGTEVVIHTAARAHIMKDRAESPLHEFRKVNTEGTLNLARQAAQSGVKRFIFISSIKVNGESTLPNQAFSADDRPNPQDPYAQSKFEAEQGLQKLARETGMEVVIIRPPLVYGQGVKGNFQRILSWIQRGLPLPLGAVRNKRSFVAVDNLNSLIMTCIAHPQAANQVFLVSDGDDLSTTELLRKMGKAINKPARLIPIPQQLLHWTSIFCGQKASYERLFGSLQVDISKTKDLLNWEPKLSVDEALNYL